MTARPLDRSTFALAAAVVALSLGPLGGCPTPPAVRPYPPPTAEQLLAHLRARSVATRTLRAEAKVDYLEGRTDRVKVTMVFLVERPDKLRVDTESPVGGNTLWSLASDGRTFQLLDARANRFLTGEATPCNLAPLLRLPLAPSEIVDVISGGAPLLGEPVSVSWDPSHGGREVLVLRGRHGETETLRLDARGRTWDVVSVEIAGPDGKPWLRLAHDGAAVRGGVRFPEASHIEDLRRGVDVRVRWREHEVGVEPPPGAFHLAPPPGLPVENVACSDPR